MTVLTVACNQETENAYLVGGWQPHVDPKPVKKLRCLILIQTHSNVNFKYEWHNWLKCLALGFK